MMAGQKEESGVVEVYCPTAEELDLEPQVNVPCTVDGCNKTFSTSSARKVHMIKTHEIYKDEEERQLFSRHGNKKVPKVTKHFYCPIVPCNRNLNSGKPFSRLSLLKQHYHMIHAVKRYPCPKCEKRFSTRQQCTTHERDCGREFTCTCGEKHKSVAALYMHAKRKHHELPEEFKSKRRKQEPVKEPGYILVVPVPYSNPQDIQKVIKEPFPLLPHPSAFCIPTSMSVSRGSAAGNQGPYPVKISASIYPGYGQGSSGISQVRGNPCLSTTSTQTEESGVGNNKQQPKQAMATAYAQTAHSCFPSFIPMGSGQRTFKRHKKTSAIQTNLKWLHEPRPMAHSMSTSETQTLNTLNSPLNFDNRVNVAQTQTSANLRAGVPLNEASGSSSKPLSQFDPPEGHFPGPGVVPTSILVNSESGPSQYNHRLDSTFIQTSPRLQESHLESSNTLNPICKESDFMNRSGVSSFSTSSVDNAKTTFVPLNEVLIQTDLTFENFLEYQTSETQTFASVSDAMTDTSEKPTVTARVSTACMGDNNLQGTSSGGAGEHITPGMEMTGLVPRNEAESAGTSSQQEGNIVPPAAPSMDMTGLDLLFLASTEHRSQAPSLGMPRLDDAFCCQQTQTSIVEADMGHQETQTAWDWSLDEFSFLDQYTQTVLSASSANINTIASSSSDTPSSSIAETDQTGLGLLPAAFNFSNTETQTMSMFDLEMFGNSISVQTEPGSILATGTGSGLLEEEGLSSVSTQVQMSQQEMVCADAQTDAVDFERLRSRQMGSSQLASSQTQTSFWDDIESIIRSDNFTQTQFP